MKIILLAIVVLVFSFFIGTVSAQTTTPTATTTPKITVTPTPSTMVPKSAPATGRGGDR